MRRLARWWPPLVSALLVLAAFPPVHLGLVVFVALVPWLNDLRSGSGRRAFASGVAFGFVFWLGEFSFIAQFVGRWTQNSLLGLVPYLLGCIAGSLYFGLFGWLAHRAFRGRLGWTIPLLWAGVEVLRSYIIGLAFPYGLLAAPLSSFPSIIQGAHYGGIFLVSAWVALANLIIAEWMSGSGYAKVRLAAGAWLALLALSLARFATEPAGEPLSVAAGQPGLDVAYGPQGDIDLRLSTAIDDLISQSRGARLLVLPEGMIRAKDAFPPPVRFSVDPALPLIFGGQRGEHPAYQSAFAYDGNWSFADKTRLVIFGEYVPFRHQLPFLQSFDLPGGDLAPADRLTTLRVGGLRVGASLCFEGLFPDISYRHALQGANLLAIMSIDDWYLGTNAPEQLRDAAVWRAIEVGAPVVRSASLGYTLVADARGRVIAQAPLGKRVALRATVRVPAQADLFPLLPLFPGLAALSLVAVPVLVWRRSRPDSPRPPGPPS